MKILYAAADNSNSKIQLRRFLNNVSDKYIIKIAAYKRSSPNINIDWTLNCLYNMFNGKVSLNNRYFELYYKQIRQFAPDLIISDLEYFTTYAANALNIPVWQVSSSLLDFAIDSHNKYDTGLHGNYANILKKDAAESQILTYMTSNADRNFVSSCFCDVPKRPNLINNSEWIRPYFVIGDHSNVCKHNVVGTTMNKNKNIISIINKYKDSVLFTDSEFVSSKITCKRLINEEEFACNLFNCNFFISEGQSQLTADAFYNGKYSNICPDLFDNECIINSLLSSKYELCNLIYDSKEELKTHKINVSFNSSTSFLHELL